jgi:ArsR family metal-binding transcriptional regulator
MPKMSAEELERYIREATADRASSTHQFRENARKQLRLGFVDLESELAGYRCGTCGEAAFTGGCEGREKRDHRLRPLG